MATPQELRLAGLHRRSQAALQIQAIAYLTRLWGVVDPDRIIETSDQWISAAVLYIADQNRRSQAIARDYLRSVYLASTGRRLVRALPEARIPEEAIRQSLAIRGPLLLRRAQRRGMDIDAALRLAQTESSRAGVRHALNGSRDVLRTFAAEEPRAGWSRVTSGSACEFCRMLASRGAVYSERTVDFPAHDGCSCNVAVEFR